MNRGKIVVTSLVVICSLGCGSKPNVRGRSGFTEPEWLATASALDSIRRAAEYRDENDALYQPRYLEAEKQADAAAIALRGHPTEAKRVKECARTLADYRYAVAWLTSTLKLIETLNNPIGGEDGPSQADRITFQQAITDKKTNVSNKSKAVDFCIAEIKGYL